MAGKTKDATIIAHLVVDDSVKAAEFYRDAFGGEILGIHKTPDGKVMHAELNIGGARLMLADVFPGFGCGSPQTLGGSPVVLNLYVKEDVDSLFNQAVAAGAKVTMPLGEPVLGRPLWPDHRSFWPSLGIRPARRRCCSGRDGTPR